MVAYDPAERPTMMEIVTDPWVKGEVYSDEEIKDLFAIKKLKIQHLAE